jgi:hypothetical protein
MKPFIGRLFSWRPGWPETDDLVRLLGVVRGLVVAR